MEVKGSQQFSFELKNDISLIATSKCELFSQSLIEEKISNEKDVPSFPIQPNFNDRLTTYLVCSIIHKDNNWAFLLKSDKEKPIEVHLKTENQFYRVKGISQLITLVDGEKDSEKRESLPSISINSDLEFYNNNKQVGAFSFAGKTKAWIKNDLPIDTRELLFGHVQLVG